MPLSGAGQLVQICIKKNIESGCFTAVSVQFAPSKGQTGLKTASDRPAGTSKQRRGIELGNPVAQALYVSELTVHLGF